jgi:MerR family copper efflux transcriptional regulator
MNHPISPAQAHSFPARPAPATNEPRWAIEEVTARADVSERLVRYCDVQGLLGSAKRTGATGRRYTPDDISVLRFIRRTHVLGFGINEIAQLLALWRGGQAPQRVLQRLVNAYPDAQHPSCPILEALIQAEQTRSSPAPLP